MTQQTILTPSDDTAGDDKLVPADERCRDDGVQVEALAKHPHEVAGREILRQGVQHTTPHLP